MCAELDSVGSRAPPRMTEQLRLQLEHEMIAAYRGGMNYYGGDAVDDEYDGHDCGDDVVVYDRSLICAVTVAEGGSAETLPCRCQNVQ